MGENLENRIFVVEHGAAENVAGSNFMIHIGPELHAVDIGKKYQKGEEHEPFSYKPSDVKTVTFTHEHMDHIGLLPKLKKEGFNGPLITTPEGFELGKLQLGQIYSGPFIHNKWVKGKKYKHGPKAGQWIPFQEILYEYSDFQEIKELFVSHEDKKGIPYQTPFKLSDKIQGTFYDAGHIPGSSQILFEIKPDGKKPIKLLTTYDLGRTDYKTTTNPIADIPIVRFPHTDFGKDIDYVVVEATYGNKTHGSLDDSIKEFEDSINYVAKNDGRLVIPAFSIMRTQMIWNFFYRLQKENRIPPDFKLFSNSSTAHSVARIMLKYINNMDERAQIEFANKKDNPFNFENLVKLDTKATTAWLKDRNMKGSAIISSSGMGDMGGIVRVLEQTLKYHNNIIMGTGYAAPGTRMDLLYKGETEIPFIETAGIVHRKAAVRKMGGLSGHADINETIAHLKNMKDPAKGEHFKRIFIKHGEKASCHALRKALIEAGYRPGEVIVMEKDEHYFLD
ncbi:MAG: MBL fold metallo-hydrolase [Nanoarchaeota archaeon]|nr:MBL fold metallo-hydrolase [Nanoarchaeota archaeon]MBU1320826.1 MBL fold metallo-hydrolase [Nanoarchaeota archaeon]MBU1596836.1 MBL fold metallo-hydrolase [Nanoarchaeota archaeon]MBU2440904.1 MBL fold metallo-hydrolase [Nanoarchaeota archaeon]